MKALLVVLILCYTFQPDLVNSSADKACVFFSCGYSCDIMSRYVKLFLNNSDIDSVAFLNISPALSSKNSSRDITSHPSHCSCKSFLVVFQLSEDDLQTFKHSSLGETEQRCFMMVFNGQEEGILKNDVESLHEPKDVEEQEDEYFMKTADGFFVILVLLVVAFVLWIVLVISVTWYAHSQRSSDTEFLNESQNLMVHDNHEYRTIDLTSPTQRTNASENAEGNKYDSLMRDVSDITLYSSLPTVPSAKCIL